MFRTNWTNACEIFRDLTVAQGDVPVSVEGTLGAGDKPPALNIKEETEEEYFLCSGGAIEEAPDLGLIQEMLNMMREEIPSDEEITQEDAVVITKPNPIPEPAPVLVKPKKAKEKKPKRRNIALESFIGLDVTPKNEVKLLKPEDLITKPNVSEPDPSTVESSIHKVNDWLQSNEGTKVNKKSAVCLQTPTNMFRKKSKAKSPNDSPKENLSVKTDSNPKSPSKDQSKEFVPSAYAIEYVNKLKEKAKMKESTVEDIWTRAEKQMKLIDEKRKAEAAAIKAVSTLNTGILTTDVIATTDIAATTTDITTTDTAAILQDTEEATTTSNEQDPKTSPRDPREKLELPGHRHLLTDDCIVCQAFTEFGYTGFC